MFLNPFLRCLFDRENFHRATARNPSLPIPFLSLSLSSLSLFVYLRPSLSLRIFFTLSEPLILPCSRSTNGGCVTMTTYELSVTCRPFPSLSHVPCTMCTCLYPSCRRYGPRWRDRDMLHNFDNASANMSPQMSDEGHNETWRNFDNASAIHRRERRECNDFG